MSLEFNKKELLYLLSSQSGITYELVGNRLKLSKRSIKMLIESLQYNYGDILSIHENNNRLYLTIHNEDTFKKLVTEELLHGTDFNSFHKRQALFFKCLIDRNNYISAEEIAEYLGISRRSLSRDINRMRSVLDNFNLTIESKAGVGIKLIGSELDKRLLYIYWVLDYLDEHIELPAEVVDVYSDFMVSQNFPFDVQRALISALKLTWERKEYELNGSEFFWFTKQSKLDLPDIVYEVLGYYLRRSVTDEEKTFLTFPLQMGLIPTAIERSDVLAVVKDALAITVREYGLKLEVDADAELLQRHVIYLLNRSVMRWQFTEVGLRESLINSAFSIIISKFFIKYLSEKLLIYISESESALLAAWMELLLARKSKPLISKIAVISQAGLSFKLLVESQVKEVFGSDINVDFLELTNHAPYEELQLKYDLVFLDNLMHSQELFQPYLSLSLVTNENVEEKQKLELTVLAQKLQIYCSCFTVSLDMSKTYEYNLESVLAKLELKSIVDNTDVRALLQKELKYPSISEGGFAYPHMTVSCLEQITIVVAKESELSLDSLEGIVVQDFVLLLVPTELDEFHENLLYNIFDNIFRTQPGNVKERLGFSYMGSASVL